MKRRESHVQPASHSPSPFTAQSLEAKSPIFSPDLDSGACRKFSLGNRSTIKRLVKNEMKPRFFPDRLDSPIFSAGLEIFSLRGGVLAIVIHDTRVVEGRIPRPKSPIISPESQIKARDSQNVSFHADPKGNTQGSKNPGQADSTPVSKKQARKHTRTRRGSGKKIL